MLASLRVRTCLQGVICLLGKTLVPTFFSGQLTKLHVFIMGHRGCL